MTIVKKLHGTGKKSNYTKAERIKALKRLEVNGFNLMKTEKELGISVPSLKRWRDELGTEVFGKQPRADIAVRMANSEAELCITRNDVQKHKEEIAHKALDKLSFMMDDPRNKIQKLFTPSVLIEIAKLPTEVAGPGTSGGDAISNAINKLAQFEMEKEQRKKAYENAQILKDESDE